MRTTQRAVYYCDHCGRHRLTKTAIETHEPKCAKNPRRSCGWCRVPLLDVPPLATALAERAPLVEADIDWLRGEVDGGPLCMLAVVVQSSLSGYDRALFVYPDEVERFRAEERASDRESVW